MTICTAEFRGVSILLAGVLLSACQSRPDESAHAVHAAMRQALLARESGEKKVILFNLSGHGIFDMAAYEAYLGGKMA